MKSVWGSAKFDHSCLATWVYSNSRRGWSVEFWQRDFKPPQSGFAQPLLDFIRALFVFERPLRHFDQGLANFDRGLLEIRAGLAQFKATPCANQLIRAAVVKSAVDSIVGGLRTRNVSWAGTTLTN